MTRQILKHHELIFIDINMCEDAQKLEVKT